MPKRQVRLALLCPGGVVLLNPNERAIGGGPGKAPRSPWKYHLILHCLGFEAANGSRECYVSRAYSFANSTIE